jgi:hypothetical protein
MKKTLILHIGMGKTGTTALQHFFWSNRRVLAAHDIDYPSYGSVAEAHHLISPHVPPFLKDVWKFKTVDEWAPRLRKSGQSRILLSSELMAWALPEIVEVFCREARDCFDLKVVVYVRRQDEMIMADFNQLVKSGSQKRELERVLERQIRRFDYETLIRPWAASVGNDNVIVRPYERQQFHGGDIRRDFAWHVFGLELSGRFELSTHNPNPRLSHSALEYKLHLNKLLRDAEQSSKFNDALMAYSALEDDTTQDAFSAQPLLSAAARNHILACCSESNAAVARLYMHRSDGLLFFASPPEESDERGPSALPLDRRVAITRYIQQREPRLITLLNRSVESTPTSEKRLHKEGVDYFEPCLRALSARGRGKDSWTFRRGGQ